MTRTVVPIPGLTEDALAGSSEDAPPGRASPAAVASDFDGREALSSQVRFSGAGGGARRPAATEAELDRALVVIPAGKTDLDKTFSVGRCDLLSPIAESECWKEEFWVGGLAKEGT